MGKLKIRYIVSCLLVLVVLIVGTSCTIPDIIGAPTPTQTPAAPVPATPAPINPTWTPPASPPAAPPAAPPASGRTVPSALPDFVSVIARVRPSVVAINTKVPTLSIFGTFEQEGAGSGWIIDRNGLVVTNNHVVEGAKNVNVTLEDGRTFTAETVRTDPVADMAVLKINATDLPAAKVGDSSKLQVGQWVVAIGNSLGLGISATKGIVSALGVSVEVGLGQTLYGLIQTDAAINPGNSGGPLVDLDGEVIGINSIKVARIGVEGMGYAIGIKEALPIIDDLIKVGYVIRPYLGVGLYTVDQVAVRRYRLTVDKGVLVTEVSAGSPSDKAGIKPGDVIVSFNGKDVATVDELVRAIHSHKIGQSVSIGLWRGNGRINASAVLSESPSR
ncbi:MAG: trypsin-like peptidase domain-containing protein [Dehalococcoidia bacterium]|nr:trypsin-like peptidase domain-containing protein [Dehalococcoidia bacterium]